MFLSNAPHQTLSYCLDEELKNNLCLQGSYGPSRIQRHIIQIEIDDHCNKRSHIEIILFFLMLLHPPGPFEYYIPFVIIYVVETEPLDL